MIDSLFSDSPYNQLIASVALLLLVSDLWSLWKFDRRLLTTRAASAHLLARRDGRNGANPSEAVQRWADRHLADGLDDADPGAHIQVLRDLPADLRQPAPTSRIRFAPALLTALGVLGTFYGIATGLQSLDKASIGQDTEKMMAAIWGLIEGMNTAFDTSLVGLGAAGVTIVVMAATDTARKWSWNWTKAGLAAVARPESPTDLLRRLVATDQQDAHRAQLDAAQKLGAAATAMEASLATLGKGLETFDAGVIGDRVGKVIEEKMEPVFTGMHSELQKIQRLMADQNEDILTKLLADLRTEVFDPVTERLDQSAATSKRAAEAVERLTTELGGAIQTIEKFQTDTLQKLATFTTDLKELLDTFRGETEGVLRQVSSEIHRAVEQSVEGMSAQREAFEASAATASTTFKGIRVELEQALERRGEEERRMLEQTREGVVTILAEAQTAFSNQTDTLAEVGTQASNLMLDAKESVEEGLSNIDAALRTTCNAVESQLDAFRRSYQERLDAFFRQQNDLLEQTLGQQRDGLAAVVRSLDDVFKAEHQRRVDVQKSVEDTFTRLTEASAEIRELADAVGLTNSARMNQLQEAASTIGRQVKSLELQYRRMDEHFEAMLTAGHDALRGYVDAANAHNGQFYRSLDEASAKILSNMISAADYLVASEQNRRVGEQPEPRP